MSTNPNAIWAVRNTKTGKILTNSFQPTKEKCFNKSTGFRGIDAIFGCSEEKMHSKGYELVQFKLTEV